MYCDYCPITLAHFEAHTPKEIESELCKPKRAALRPTNTDLLCRFAWIWVPATIPASSRKARHKRCRSSTEEALRISDSIIFVCNRSFRLRKRLIHIGVCRTLSASQLISICISNCPNQYPYVCYMHLLICSKAFLKVPPSRLRRK